MINIHEAQALKSLIYTQSMCSRKQLFHTNNTTTSQDLTQLCILTCWL